VASFLWKTPISGMRGILHLREGSSQRLRLPIAGSFHLRKGYLGQGDRNERAAINVSMEVRTSHAIAANTPAGGYMRS